MRTVNPQESYIFPPASDNLLRLLYQGDNNVIGSSFAYILPEDDGTGPLATPLSFLEIV